MPDQVKGAIMELQEFIAGTLEGITMGIEETKKRVGELAVVNPSTGQFHSDDSKAY